MFDLTGKVALVTGASGGIGGDVARFLHRQGAALIISGTNLEALNRMGDELGDRVHVLPCRLDELGAVDQLVRDAQGVAGAVDILINNAGITRDNLLVRMKDSEWDDVLLVNLTAVFRLTRGLLRGMLKRRFGRIISVSSVVGVAGNVGQANYAAAKAGLLGFTKSLALECASRGVTANCVAPGFIRTPMTDRLTDDQRQRILLAVPLGRMGCAADVASAVVYLASDEACYVTGQVLHVNGGMVMSS